MAEKEFENDFSTIIEEKEWEQLERHLSDFGPGDLVAFDVDHTLIIQRDSIFLPYGEAFVDEYLTLNAPGITEEERLCYSSLIFQYNQPRLIDKKCIEIIQTLKMRGCKVIALTAMPTGRFGHIQNMQEWRYDQLASLGIDFSDSSFHGEHFFSEFGAQHLEPAFHRGILFSATAGKGDVLIKFLEKVEFRPQKVFFIDDQRSWVESFERKLNDYQIPTTCVHFRKAEELQTFNHSIAEKQLNILIKEKRWISDEEAARLLIEI